MAVDIIIIVALFLPEEQFKFVNDVFSEGYNFVALYFSSSRSTCVEPGYNFVGVT